MTNDNRQANALPPTPSLSTGRGRCVFAFVATALLAGCVHDTQPSKPPSIYTGPTEPLDVVLAKINANNGRIATFVGAGRFDATFKDHAPLSGYANVLHSKPNKLLLKLNKESVDLMTAGVNDTHYWLSTFGDNSITYFGTPLGPGQENTRLPLAPELLADVLGIATLNTDLLAQPVPTMRFNPDYDAYMLTWSTPLKDRWIVLREIWYDRASLEPRLIWLFDRNGRVVLRAKLGQFAPLEDVQGDNPPRAARRFDIAFPENGTRLTLSLDLARTRRGGAPNPITYRFDPAKAGTDRVENLDEPSR